MSESAATPSPEHRLVASLDLTGKHPSHYFRCSCGFGCVKGILANPIDEVMGMIQQHIEALTT